MPSFTAKIVEISSLGEKYRMTIPRQDESSTYKIKQMLFLHIKRKKKKKKSLGEWIYGGECKRNFLDRSQSSVVPSINC